MSFHTLVLLTTATLAASLDCKWDYDTQEISCPNHLYVDRITGKEVPVKYHTSPFTRPLEGDTEDKAQYYEHDDSRKDQNGTASFSYFFNMGRNVGMDSILEKDGCKETIGDDPSDPLKGPSAAFQRDDNRDFKCHRIAGDVKNPDNVVVGPLENDNPAAGFFMTIMGGDDCSDTWRGDSGGYTKRSMTYRVFCDTSSEGVAKLPDFETIREDMTCMYSIDVFSSHGCPLSCGRVEGFSGGKYGSTCNGPAGTCVSGDVPTTTDAKNLIGEPVCVCDESEGWVGPKCDKKCPRDKKTGKTTCDNGHCAYDAVLDQGRCFCYTGYGGTHCETSVPTGGGTTPGSLSVNGVNVFGWILAVGMFLSLIGLIVYHKRSVGEWGGSGGGGGSTGYGEL